MYLCYTLQRTWFVWWELWYLAEPLIETNNLYALTLIENITVRC